ncbi:hypothetical protein BaRGS_00024806 [Batillaria attramentaria]|uniref:Uncharacterized protein n=1 Tax=Batillaria attramentaria TaxID=370345 RepID=A0ABD0KA23_9CAEN
MSAVCSQRREKSNTARNKQQERRTPFLLRVQIYSIAPSHLLALHCSPSLPHIESKDTSFKAQMDDFDESNDAKARFSREATPVP